MKSPKLQWSFLSEQRDCYKNPLLFRPISTEQAEMISLRLLYFAIRFRFLQIAVNYCSFVMIFEMYLASLVRSRALTILSPLASELAREMVSGFSSTLAT